MADKKEPMIGQESRPTAIDYDMPIANFKLRDLYAVIHSHPEMIKVEKETFKPEKEKEQLKPEKEKEYFKPEKEKEVMKGEKEKEHFKPEKEKEHFKPEKEALKPEKESSKPEKVFDPGDILEDISNRVIAKLKASGAIK